MKRFAYVEIPSASDTKFIIGNAFSILKKYYKNIANVQVAYDKSGTEFYALVTLNNGEWFEVEASEMVGVNPCRGNPASSVGDIKKISELQDKKYSLVQNDYDVKDTAQMLGCEDEEYGGFLVVVGDGDYDEAWGFYGSVPYLGKDAYRVK